MGKVYFALVYSIKYKLELMFDLSVKWINGLKRQEIIDTNWTAIHWKTKSWILHSQRRKTQKTTKRKSFLCDPKTAVPPALSSLTPFRFLQLSIHFWNLYEHTCFRFCFRTGFRVRVHFFVSPCSSNHVCRSIGGRLP